MKMKLALPVLSAALLAGMIPTGIKASAADVSQCTFTLKADKETVHPGDTVTFTLNVNPNGDTFGFEFDIGTLPEGFTYVADSIQYLESAKSKLNWKDFVVADSGIHFFITDENTVYKGGSLDFAVFKLKVGETASEFQLSPADAFALTTKADAVDADFSAPSITVPGLEKVAAVNATCQKEGVKEHYKCADDCGRVYETNDRTKPTELSRLAVSKTAHSFTKETATDKYLKAPASCKDAAVYFTSCEFCGEASNTDTFTSGDPDKSKHGETELKNKKEATCADKGYTGDEVCTICGDTVKKGEEIAATGKHTGGKATCAHKAVCDTCKQEYGELNPDDHEDTTLAGKKEPTCTEPGNTGSGKCSACGKEVEAKEIPALGHKGGTATCNKKAVCDVCHEEYGELDKSNHGDNGTEIKGEKPATETEEGYTGDKVCKGCGEVLEKGKTIPKKTSTSDPETPVDPPHTAVGSVSTPSDTEKKNIEFIDDDTDIKVSAPEGAFDNAGDITFNVVRVNALTSGDRFTFDLTFTDKDGKNVQPKTAVTVMIPVPTALKDKALSVYHIEEDGKYAEISCKIENGMVVFSASKFSNYVISGTKLSAAGDKLTDDTAKPGNDKSGSTDGAVSSDPDSSGNPATGITLAVIPVLLAAGAAVVIAKNKKK